MSGQRIGSVRVSSFDQNLGCAIQSLRITGQDIDETLLSHLSPLGWEHINLTGDYSWHQNRLVEQGKFRRFRMLSAA